MIGYYVSYPFGPSRLLLGLLCFAVICVIVALPLVLMTKKKSGGDAEKPNLVPCPDCGRHVSRLAKPSRTAEDHCNKGEGGGRKGEGRRDQGPGVRDWGPWGFRPPPFPPALPWCGGRRGVLESSGCSATGWVGRRNVPHHSQGERDHEESHPNCDSLCDARGRRLVKRQVWGQTAEKEEAVTMTKSQFDKLVQARVAEALLAKNRPVDRGNDRPGGELAYGPLQRQRVHDLYRAGSGGPGPAGSKRAKRPRAEAGGRDAETGGQQGHEQLAVGRPP